VYRGFLRVLDTLFVFLGWILGVPQTPPFVSLDLLPGVHSWDTKNHAIFSQCENFDTFSSFVIFSEFICNAFWRRALRGFCRGEARKHWNVKGILCLTLYNVMCNAFFGF